MKEDYYLTKMPQHIDMYGFCKTLLVRREMIHIKHIFTEIFVRKNIDIEKYLKKLDINLLDYMYFMTNKIRKVYKLPRDYRNKLEDIVKKDRDNLFPLLDLTKGLKKTIVLDFDGVVTDKRFKDLYKILLEKESVQICSANPCIELSWFEKNNIRLPNTINSMKGKVKKIKRLLEISKKNDFVFYIDDEVEYLEYAWMFGIKTFLWDGKKIKHFSLNTK